MTLPFVVYVASGVAAGLVGLYSLALSRAPQGRPLRPLSALSLAAAGVSLSFAAVLHPGAAPLAPLLISIGLACLAAHASAWWWLVAVLEGRAFRPTERLALALFALFGLAALVPGAVLQREVSSHEVAWLGTVFRDVPPTPVGALALAAFAAAQVVPVVRLLRRVRRGSREALLHGCTLGLAAACGASDLLVQLGLFRGPYLLPLGLAAVLLGTGWTLAARVVASARRLAALNEELARLTAERAAELARAAVVVERGRATAAIGRLAAGAAHELNNAAAVATAGLGYLAEQLVAGEQPTDLGEVRAELASSIGRMQAVAERLHQAGRFVQGRRGALRPLPLRTAVEAVLAARAPRPGLRHVVEVPAELSASLDPLLLAPLLDELVENAEAALGEAGGELRLRAAFVGGALELEVADDGPGVPRALRESLFEPFGAFEAAPGHVGLGLPAVAGLARAMGGTLTLRDVPRGACFLLRIPAESAREAA